jgi:Mrp family chromosome partitioning ATPase/capsular polysaccharide biosynthesis protein
MKGGDMTPQAYFRVFLRWWWLFVLGVVLGVGGAYAVQVLMGPLMMGSLELYSVTANVTVGVEVQGWEQDETELDLAGDLVPTYAELVTRSPITDQVIEILDLPISTNELATYYLEVEQPEKTQLIEITGKYPDAQIAASIANEAARQLQLASPTRPRGLVKIVSFAKVPDKPETEPYLLIGLGALVGLLLALGVILLIEFALDRPYTPEWAETRIDLPCLGCFRHKYTPGRPGRLDINDRLTTTLSEPTWQVVLAVLDRATNSSAATMQRGLSIVVTSPEPRESKVGVAVSLATAAAASGRRTILVDADVRRSRWTRSSELQRWFKLEQPEGVTTLAQNEYTSEGAQALLMPLMDSVISELSILPAGPHPDQDGLLVLDVFWQTLLADLCGRADLVVVNGPAIKAAPEIMPLITNADGVLVTMDLGKTRAPKVNEAEDILAKAGAKTLGLIINTQN